MKMLYRDFTDGIYYLFRQPAVAANCYERLLSYFAFSIRILKSVICYSNCSAISSISKRSLFAHQAVDFCFLSADVSYFIVNNSSAIPGLFYCCFYMLRVGL
jgi:hypothetical protein